MDDEAQYKEYLRRMLSAYMKFLPQHRHENNRSILIPRIPTNGDFYSWLKEQSDKLAIFGLYVDNNINPPAIRPIKEPTEGFETWILVHQGKWFVST